MKKMKTFFKASPFLAIVAGLMVAGVASAALLTVYTTMTGTSEVKQSVVFEGYETSHDYVIGNSPAHAGNTYMDSDKLYNTSETTAPIKFVTTYSHGGTNWWAEEPGIETSYWSTVELKHKDGDWKVIGDAKGVLTYELVSNDFNYEFEATGLTPGESYSLIYYADKPNRFEDWGGNNPGALIAEFTADEANGAYEGGNIYAEGTESQPVEGSVDLQMNLPHANDWNGTSEADYCASDGYDLCRGAKIWLVLTDDLTNGDLPLVGWSHGEYLFETDLITYNDTNNGGDALHLGNGRLDFFVKNVLDIALEPGSYMVKTEIVPVSVQ